jgi:hypothetical protein
MTSGHHSRVSLLNVKSVSPSLLTRSQLPIFHFTYGIERWRKITGDCRKLHDEELHDVASNIITGNVVVQNISEAFFLVGFVSTQF